MTFHSKSNKIAVLQTQNTGCHSNESRFDNSETSWLLEVSVAAVTRERQTPFVRLVRCDLFSEQLNFSALCYIRGG